MDFLPLFFDLRERRCLVVGGGAVAARKAELLARAGAHVHLVAESLCAPLREAVERGQMSHAAAQPTRDLFVGAALAIVAIDDAAAAEQAVQTARDAGVPVNAVDRPALCDAIIPAIVDRAPVLLAISTGGAAPVLGRLLRSRLEALLPLRLGRLAEMARERRAVIRERVAPERRRRYWESVLQGPVAELVFSGDEQQAARRMDAQLDENAETDAATGEIYLLRVPADDDAEQLTLRALRLLQQADVAFHDADLPRPLIDLIRRDAERHAIEANAYEDCLHRARALAGTGQRVAWFVRTDSFRALRDALVNDAVAVQTAGGA